MLARHVSDLTDPSSGAISSFMLQKWYVVFCVLLDTSRYYPTTAQDVILSSYNLVGGYLRRNVLPPHPLDTVLLQYHIVTLTIKCLILVYNFKNISAPYVWLINISWAVLGLFLAGPHLEIVKFCQIHVQRFVSCRVVSFIIK